jgi:hypothetical protein
MGNKYLKQGNGKVRFFGHNIFGGIASLEGCFTLSKFL